MRRISAIASIKLAEHVHARARRMAAFHWNTKPIAATLACVRHRQDRLIGHMEALGFNLQQEALLETLTADVLESSETEWGFRRN
jgi:hypothetical protein